MSENTAGMMRSGPGAIMGTRGRTMQPNGRPHASLTVLASGITASVNDVMRGNGAADMMYKNGIHDRMSWRETSFYSSML